MGFVMILSLVQRPADLDTACVLAALQEEVGDPYKRRDYKRHEPGFSSKTSSRKRRDYKRHEPGFSSKTSSRNLSFELEGKLSSAILFLSIATNHYCHRPPSFSARRL
jgi:hypothetical protein